MQNLNIVKIALKSMVIKQRNGVSLFIEEP